MSQADALGTLEPVQLRDIWQSESSNFTPWLAKEENIERLGKAIGIELEVQAVEEHVGSFRADILARDTLTDRVVLIENQLEGTDHSHLGQLVTYAAGLEATTIIWIAANFREEHRAALDWLNNATDSSVSFFGIQIELWKIGDSAAAPRFTLASKPNDWAKTVHRIRAQADNEGLNSGQQQRLAFWTAFDQHLNAGSTGKTFKPAAAANCRFSAGKSHVQIECVGHFQDNRLTVNLTMGSDTAHRHFVILHRDRDLIEQEFGEPLQWHFDPSRKGTYITVERTDVKLSDEQAWPEIHAWLEDYVARFDAVFRKRVQALDASSVTNDELEELAQKLQQTTPTTSPAV